MAISQLESKDKTKTTPLMNDWNFQEENSGDAPGTFIDLFAGCGGLSLGLMMAGWQGLFAIEKEENAFETLEHNLIGGEHIKGFNWPAWLPKEAHDIHDLLDNYKQHLASLRGQVDLVVGGPPCQGFSEAGQRNKEDPRNQLFQKYIEVVQAINPKFVLLENVKGIKSAFKGDKQPYALLIINALEKEGYKIFLNEQLPNRSDSGILRAVDYGVPQVRPRFFAIGVLSDLVDEAEEINPFQLINQIRGKFLNKRGLSTEKLTTIHDAISDLETAHSQPLIECVDSKGFKQISYKGPITSYQRLMHKRLEANEAPNSLRLARHTDAIVQRFQEILIHTLQNGRRGVALSKEDRAMWGIKKSNTVPLDPRKPSKTVTTLPDDFIHYSEPRILTVREMARLQAFPDWFSFKGKYTTGGKRRKMECPRYTQVGNAVPPLLAELLGETLNILKSRLKPTVMDNIALNT